MYAWSSFQIKKNQFCQAEHHARAFKNVYNVGFYQDDKRGRVSMLTTLEIKHAMCTLVNAMMRWVFIVLFLWL
jgi:hypothetical protein